MIKHQDVKSGDDLRDWISSRGLSQQEFASLIGMSRSGLYRWLRKRNLRKPWLPCLLEGAEHRLQARKQATRSRNRRRSYKRYSKLIPKRQAHANLPANVREIIGDLPDSGITWV